MSYLSIIIDTLKETFRVRGPSSVNVEGVVAIIVFVAFAVSVVGEAFNVAHVPSYLQRVVDVLLGWFLRSGYSRARAR